jgi:integration host factor subunit alpha
MRKVDLANEIRSRIGGMSKREAGLLVTILLQSISDALAKGELVKISGFGCFSVKKKKDRVGRNPHSGGELIIGARKVVTFKASQILRDLLNR